MKKVLLIVALLAIIPLVAAQEGTAMETPLMLLTDLGVIIVAATLIGFAAAGLKQPLIPAYIIAGILVGPVGSKFLFGGSLINDPLFIRTLSELGITFLLFTVGIEMELSRMREVGKAALSMGLAQVVLTFVLGMGVAVLMGFGFTTSAYFGLILAFSSTMVVIKILSDRDEIETLHGRIMLGILLMQDIIVVIVLSVLASGDGLEVGPIADSVLKAVGLFSMAVVISRYVAPRILRLVANSAELIFLTALSFAMVFALSSHLLGFSTAIGGFLGGLSLAVFPYNLEISNKIKPLRDFFAIMFFVALGMQFYPIFDLGSLIIPTVVFTILIIVAKPLIITLLSMLAGYEKRTSFLAGIGLGQISEFSLILAMGLLVSEPNSIIFPMTLILGILTISVTPYLIRYGNALYIPFSGLLTKFDGLTASKKKQPLEHIPQKRLRGHVVVFGAHIMGIEVIEALQEMGEKFIVVDHNPDIIKKLISRGIPSIYGDVENIEVLEKAGINRCKLVVSTIPDEDDSLLLIKKTKELNKDAMVFVTAKTLEHAIKFYREGADYIIHLKLLGGKEASERVKVAMEGGKKSVLKKKLKEISFLEKKRREEMAHRISKDVIRQIDELRAEEEVKKSETFGEE